ncbi:MAG: serpin family protein [Gemmatimonas sp.]
MNTLLIARRITGAFGLLVLSACGNASVEPTAVDSLQALPRALTVVERDGVASGNRFALSLLRQVSATTGGNVLLSPLSVWVALGMTLNGAAAQTDVEMRQTLGWGTRTRDEINTAYRDLGALLPTLDPSVRVKIGNGIWVRPGLTVDSSFARDLKSYFSADVRTAATPQAMFDAVNVWGSQQTDGLVPRVLDQPPPDGLLMLLANAVLFDGRWRDAFDPAETTPAPFALEVGAPVSVPMMMRKGHFRGHMTSAYTAVELPYGNTAYSLLVVVPTTGTVSAFVTSLDSARLAEVTNGLSDTGERTTVYLPRFTVRGSIELSPVLKQMGMPRAFTDLAEFPRFFGSGAKLGFVQHGVTLEVNERGTRAAAVTVVGVVPTSLPPTFRVDRPFVFFIRERFAGTILFTGIVRDPRT